MSMITELVEKLRAQEYNIYLKSWDGKPTYPLKLMLKAADVIEELSSKLQTANMERSSQYYNGGWISVDDRLPADMDWYLGIFKEPDTGWINPLPFICGYVGHPTKATTKENWILRGFTDRDEIIDYYVDLECVAWCELPPAYKAESEET